MEHLTYPQTHNQAFDTYHDRFKKMVRQELEGDGWFLLVKNFPFKNGGNFMFTAGESIGKWQDKNLVSLFGKENYLIGRCRKRGALLTLLDFQEGDLLKEATESGLRKALTMFFKGTGISVRIFKSLKVTEQEPEGEEQGENDPEDFSGKTERLIPDLPTPIEKKKYILKAAEEIAQRARDTGMSEEPEFIKRWMHFHRYMKLADIEGSLEAIEGLLRYLTKHDHK